MLSAKNQLNYKILQERQVSFIEFNPSTHGVGSLGPRPSNFEAFEDPLTVKYIEMFHADFSYLSFY